MPIWRLVLISIFYFCFFLYGAEAQQPLKPRENVQDDHLPLAEYHFSLAQAYASDEHPERAIEEYKLALFYDPNSAMIYSRLAAEYVKKGMLAEAMETCKEGLKHDAEFVDLRLLLAGLYSTALDIKPALDQYDKILKKHPHHEEAVINKAELMIETGQIVKGLESLKEFTKKNPDAAFAWYHLARAQHQLNHFKEATIAYRTAMKVRPGFVQAALALAFLYEEKRKNSMAIAIYKKLFDENQDLIAAERLSSIYLREAKYKEAIPYLQIMEAMDPEDLNVKVKLGLIYMEMKDYEQAIEVFKKILEKSPSSDRVHYYLASIYEQENKIDLAVGELKAIQPEFKLYKDVVLHTAYLLKQNNQISEAKNYLREILTKSPRIPEFTLFRAHLEEQAQNIPEAIRILEEAVKSFPEDEKIHYYLGSLYDRQGAISKSLKEMEFIVSLNPKHVDALNYLGYTWTNEGIRLFDAERVLRKALGLSPKNAYVQDSWGWYLFVRGRLKEAIVELEKAARLKPDEPTILEHLGDAYLKVNLREKALGEYIKAKKYAPDEQTRKKVQLKIDSVLRESAFKKASKPAVHKDNP